MKNTSVNSRPVAAHFCATFLKPEMLHVYRQITACRDFRPVVFTQKRENAERFPFEPVMVVPRARTRELRRFLMRRVLGRPVQIYPGEARRLDAQFRAAGAEVVHVYFGHIGVYLLPFLKRRSLPVVVSFHGADAGVDMEKESYVQAAREVYAHADVILVRSESLATALRDNGAPPEKIRLHRTALPLEEWPYVEREAPADGVWKLVQACRLIPKKGLSTTLRAFARFAAAFPGATLTIAGEGPDEPKLRALADELGIDVWFTGFLAEAELRQLYNASHFFVHPSETGSDGDQEGVPNAMLEAMATGLPVFATWHGGIPEAVENGRDGMLVEEGDHAALADALRAAAVEPETFVRMGRSAAEAVRESFDQEVQTRVLEDCYREAIRNFNAGRIA